MILIPLQAVPSQQLNILLGGQTCTIAVYQKGNSMFMDLTANGISIQACKICQNQVRLVRAPYLGFIGDLVFFDTQGSNDPQYTGFGNSNPRYVLVYLSASEVAAL